MFGVLICNHDINSVIKNIYLEKDGHSDRFLRMENNDLRREIISDFEEWKSRIEGIPVLMSNEFTTMYLPSFNGTGEIHLPGSDCEVVVGNIRIKNGYDLSKNSFIIDFIKDENFTPLRASDIVNNYEYIFGSSFDPRRSDQKNFSLYENNIDWFLDKFRRSGGIGSNLDKDLKIYSNVVVEGVAGSGKSHILRELRTGGVYGNNGSHIEVVVFHPSTSYEEFVSGIRPNFSKSANRSESVNEGDFVTQEGAFVQMCNRAAQDPDNAYLLFIDEINRANTSRVFGDLMLVLEKSKRQDFAGLSLEGRDGALFEASVQEMPGDYVRLQTPIFKNGKEYNKLAVPTNLHVLGTMNTTDRSVGTIDLALRRRFHWVTQHPLTAEELQKAMEENGEKYPADIASWYENANLILLNQVGPDARLGHAYFFGKDGDEEAIAEALLNQLKEVAFTFNISQTILDEIGPVHGQKIFIRGAGLGARPDIVDEPYQG